MHFSNIMESCLLAPLMRITSGDASGIYDDLSFGAELASVGGVGAHFLAPGAWHRGAIYAGSAPINLVMLAQTYEHGLVQTLPNAAKRH